MRTVFNLDANWKFHLGETETKDENGHAQSYALCKAGGAVGAAGRDYDDGGWTAVDLPHDYFAGSGFSPDNLLSHGYRYRENAWYRKYFSIDEKYKGKHILLCFEGTAVNAEFYVNGSLLAHSFSAYVETPLDITDRVQFGEFSNNVISVHINGLATEGWWYEGAGIYRHVKLYIKEPVHISHNGVFVKTVKNDDAWTVCVETEVENSSYEDRQAFVKVKLCDGEETVAESISDGITAEKSGITKVRQCFTVDNPKIWDVETPNLYTVEISVISEGEQTDSVTEKTGFRTFRIDAEKGFFLNGRSLKIKGTCNHQDHAGVGVAVPDSVQRYRIKRLKEMGTNAYRCSHNPPAKEILDACDEIGLIVMDENRRFETGGENLRCLETLIKRDRNHPSVIFWSLFNEEPLQNTELGARIFKRLKAFTLKLDDTRLIMGAINGSMEGAGLEMDVTGINYGIGSIADFHAAHPDQPIMGSENNSAVTTRGCYKTDNDEHVLAGYDEETVPWGQTVRQTWDFVRKNDYFAGIFIWTGFDYRGEPTPYKWPSVSSQFGIMDTCGFEKDSYYFNKACFADYPVIHVMPHWNHNPGEEIRVAVPTNCDETELFLNGSSLGRKKSDCILTPEWTVRYEPGEIKAVGYIGGVAVCEDVCKTAGKPARIKIDADSQIIAADGEDTAVLNFSLVDGNGVCVPDACDKLEFIAEGDVFVRGVGNGDPNSHESDVLPERRLYAGRCQALVSAKSGGSYGSLTVKAEGLPEEKIQFTLKKTDVVQLPLVKSFVISDFTMSAITEEKPDPLVEIKDNDMNSFVPVSALGSHQNDYHNGWRIYRALVRLPEGNKFALELLDFVSDETEIYVNGKLVFVSAEKFCYANKKGVTFTFDAKGNETADIRFLFRVAGKTYAGIRDGILIFAKQ